MRVYEARMVYSLISLGEEVPLYRPARIAEYLRSAFEENPMQEAFYCIYLHRKNHPLGRHLITRGTASGTLVSPRSIPRHDLGERGGPLRGAQFMGRTSQIVLCVASSYVE